MVKYSSSQRYHKCDLKKQSIPLQTQNQHIVLTQLSNDESVILQGYVRRIKQAI